MLTPLFFDTFFENSLPKDRLFGQFLLPGSEDIPWGTQRVLPFEKYLIKKKAVNAPYLLIH